MYAKIIDNVVVQYPYSVWDLRKDNKNVSFPADESLIPFESYNAYPVASVAKPVEDYTKNVVEGTPEYVNGQLSMVWIVTDATEDEKAQRLEAQWAKIRKQRNQELTGCDWTQLPDVPLSEAKKAEFVAFRAALRDITTQTNPFEIAWPTNPFAE